MRKCPRCGFVDEVETARARRRDANRGSRADYMREYRLRKRKAAAAAARKAKKRKDGAA